MVRTQIQLPDELYARARGVADAREMSFAELAGRGIEHILNAFPAERTTTKEWRLPIITRSRLIARLDKLHDIAADEEGARSVRAERR